MPHIRTLVKPTLSLIAAGVLLTNGCALPHAPLPWTTQVSPAQYCPGDTVTASYDAGSASPCVSRSGFNCPDLMPNVTMASTPEVFPTQNFNGLSGQHTFQPNVDRFDVAFSSDKPNILWPIVQSDGRPGFGASGLRPSTQTATRIDGDVTIPLTHTGLCIGASSFNLPAPVIGPPVRSSRLLAREICNDNDVPITATVSGGGAEYTVSLAPRSCQPFSIPGMPMAGIPAQVVSVRPDTAPIRQCESLLSSPPPPTLFTHLTMTCGG